MRLEDSTLDSLPAYVLDYLAGSDHKNHQMGHEAGRSFQTAQSFSVTLIII